MRSRLTAPLFALTATALLATAVYAGCGDCAAGDKDHKHAEGHQSHAKVGEPAPTFTLTDHEGNTVDLAKLTEDEKIVVLEWFAPDCPFVVRHHEKESTMTKLENKYRDKGVVWLAINSSHYADQDYNKKWAAKWDMPYPVLNDQDGKVGHTYEAKTTPHMYVIDAEGTLVYAGGIDNDPRGKMSDDETVNYVDQALSELTSGKSISTAQAKPYGCSVKYAKQAKAETTDKTAKGCTKCEEGKACEKCAA